MAAHWGRRFQTARVNRPRKARHPRQGRPPGIDAAATSMIWDGYLPNAHCRLEGKRGGVALGMSWGKVRYLCSQQWFMMFPPPHVMQCGE